LSERHVVLVLASLCHGALLTAFVRRRRAQPL
jgi:hypothetical protein